MCAYNPHQADPSHPPRALDAATVSQIQANLITYVRLFAGLPGITFVEGECVWIAGDESLGNHILRTHLQTPHDETSINEQLADLVRQLGTHGDQFDWFVFPSCRPTNLGESVAAYGKAGGPDGAWELYGEISGSGGTWMLADLTALPTGNFASSAFHVELVDSEATLMQWRLASAAGFGHDLQHDLHRLKDEPFYMAYARHGFGPDAYSRHYIGYLENEPVTSATLLLSDGIAGLFDVSTPPLLRRQGFASAISHHLLHEAYQRGYQQAYVWSSPMGRGVYADIGFEHIDLGMREYQWRKG